MRIPDGDLAPARRRRYGGSYGRRRRRRNVRIAFGLLLVVAGAVAAYLVQQHDTKAPQGQSLRTCPTTAPTPAAGAVTHPMALPRPQQVKLVVLNGTSRNGLAKTVGDALAALGFTVAGQGNAPAALNGASTVTYGPGDLPAATLVGRWVLGSQLVSSASVAPGSVHVVLGSAFRRLSTPAEVAAAPVPAGPAVTATTVPSPASSGCPA